MIMIQIFDREEMNGVDHAFAIAIQMKLARIITEKNGKDARKKKMQNNEKKNMEEETQGKKYEQKKE